MGNPKIRWRSGDSVVATVGPVALAFWGGSADEQLLPCVHQVSIELGRSNPSGIAHVNLIDTSRPVGITEQSRSGILKLLRDRTIPLLASAIILPGEGFLSALVRSALAGATLMAKSQAAIRFVESERAAEAFLMSPACRELRLAPGELLEAIEAVRRLIGSTRPPGSSHSPA